MLVRVVRFPIAKTPMIRVFRIQCHALGLAASVVVTSLATAAEITWTSAPYLTSGGYGQNLNTGQFATSGTLIRAENVGGGATSFDGIDFTAGAITFSGGSFGGFHDAGANTSLARTGDYGNGGAPGTVTLTGLTSGNAYRIQALVYDGRGGETGRTVSFDGVNQGQYANGITNVTWGNGLLVTGTFLADAATQNFTIEAFSGASSVGAQLNALLVHEFANGTPVLENASVASITATTAQASVNLTSVAGTVTLYWDTVDQGTGPWAQSNPLGSQAIGPVSGALSGLAGDTRYFYRFLAVNTLADPDTEGWSTGGTSFATALSGKAPANPSATAFSATEIDIAWTDVFDTETGFIIERSPDGIGSWTLAGNAPANAQFFSDGDRLPATTYHYRVFAQNGAGLSDPSAVVSATTNPATPGIRVEAWYRMGDDGQGSGNRPLDSTTNARSFTGNVGNATLSPNGGGYANDAYYTFNGTDQGYFGTNYDAPENNIGIEVWVRTSDFAQTNHHVFGTGSSQNGINIGYDAGGSRGWFGAVAGQAFIGAVGTANYTTHEWIHLAVVRDAGVATFYVNGVASGSAANVPFDATAPHFAVNAGGAPGGYFGGDVAEARIFSFDPGQFQISHLLYPGTTSPYDSWAQSFNGLSDPGADLDFDGGSLATGIEWVTGGDPTDGSDDVEATPTFDAITSPTHFLFSFRRSDAAAGDAGTTIVVEYSSNLSTWRNTAVHGVTDGVVTDDSSVLAGGFRQVTVSIPRALAPNGALFARLKVTRP